MKGGDILRFVILSKKIIKLTINVRKYLIKESKLKH
jgi:hypothetical protein